MNAIEFAIRDIKNKIPSKILEIAFYKQGYNDIFGSMTSIDENIRQRVIRDIVMPYVNTTLGTMHDVPMRHCILYEADAYGGYVYRIPKSETNGRNILSIVNIATYGQVGMSLALGSYVSMNRSSQYSSLAAEGIRSASEPINMSHVNFNYKGNNIVSLPSALGTYPSNAVFRCHLEYDEALSSLSVHVQRVFAKLCLAAAKMHIYNELTVRIDQGYIEGGYEIGTIKEIIDGYSDAAADFDTILEEDWRIASHYGDAPQRKRAIKIGISRSS